MAKQFSKKNINLRIKLAAASTTTHNNYYFIINRTGGDGTNFLSCEAAR